MVLMGNNYNYRNLSTMNLIQLMIVSLFLFLRVNQITCNSTSSTRLVQESYKGTQKIINMAKTLISYFKSSHLNIYYKDHKWNKFGLAAMRNKIENSFVQAFEDPVFSEASVLGTHNSVTLHLILDSNFETLDKLLRAEQMRLENNIGVETVGRPKSNYFLIRLPRNESHGDIKKRARSSPLRYDSLVFGFKKDFYDDDKIHIFDMYKIGVDTDVSMKSFGEFNSNLSVPIPEIWQRRENMEGYHLRAAGILSRPFIDYIKDNCTNPKCFHGMNSQIWHSLQEKMNFTYTIEKQTVFGVYKNKTWNGVIGMLHREEIDIAPQGFSVSKGRASVVDFLPGIAPNYVQLFIRNPATLHNWVAYLEPLKSPCWFAILAFLLIAPLIVAGISHYGCDSWSEDYSVLGYYVLVAKTLIMRPPASMPKSSSNRLTVLTMMLVGSFIYWTWEATLISFVSVRKTTMPIRTLKDVLEKSDIKIYIRKGTAYVDDFRYAKEAYKQELFKTRIEPYLIKGSLSDISKIVAEDSSFAVYHSRLVKEYEPYQTCKIVDTEVYYSRPPFSFAMPKNSPYYASFHYEINALKEGGIIKRYQDARKKLKECPDQDRAISGGQCFSAFVLLMGAAGFSLICFAMEWVVHKDFMKTQLKSMNDIFEKFFLLATKKNQSEIGEDDINEEQMRKYLDDIKEAIHENRSSPSVFMKFAKCEKEIFRFYDLQRNTNKNSLKNLKNMDEVDEISSNLN